MSDPVAAPRLAVGLEPVPTPDGLTLAAYRFGGHGPALLLVHATGFHAHAWLPLLDGLRAAFTVFAFDLRGHGESASADDLDRFHFRRMGGDVLAVADHFGVAPFLAIGHSVGGALIVQAEILRPGTVKRAVLCEPIVLRPETRDFSPTVAAAEHRRTVFPSTADMIRHWSRHGPFSTFAPEALRAYVEYGVRDRPDGGVELKCSRQTEVMTFKQDVTAGLWDRLARFGPPTLILAGDRSASRVAPLAEAQARAMANATAERVAGVTHFFPFERPAEFAERATRFLEETRRCP